MNFTAHYLTYKRRANEKWHSAFEYDEVRKVIDDY